MASQKIFISIVILVSIAVFSSCRDKVDCRLYHTGEFELIDESRDIIIMRDQEFQIETMRSTGSFTKFRIFWLNPCTYRLFFLEGTTNIHDAWDGHHMDVMILEGTDGEYTYKSTFSKTGLSEVGKVKKIASI